MPVLNCCTGCQGPMQGPGGPVAYRYCSGLGPSCVNGQGPFCFSPCGDCPGVTHGARGGTACSYYTCGYGCIGGCTSGLCLTCCGL